MKRGVLLLVTHEYDEQLQVWHCVECDQPCTTDQPCDHCWETDEDDRW